MKGSAPSGLATTRAEASCLVAFDGSVPAKEGEVVRRALYCGSVDSARIVRKARLMFRSSRKRGSTSSGPLRRARCSTKRCSAVYKMHRRLGTQAAQCRLHGEGRPFGRSPSHPSASVLELMPARRSRGADPDNRRVGQLVIASVDEEK